MRITDELKNKIRTAVNDKYTAELAFVNSTINAKRNEKNNSVVEKIKQDIEGIKNTHPELYRLLMIYRDNYRFGCDYYGTISSNSGHFYDDPEINALNKKAEAIRTAISTDVENMMITVSYGKDINDIKAAFAEHGLTF